jgi:hypothetical protein
MTIRLMVWNIERFGINKLGTSDFDTNASRAAYINGTITEANPDILVFVEVQTASRIGVGTLVTDTSGGPAVRAIWNALPGGTIVGNAGPWAIVPPLAINIPVSLQGNNAYSEAIAVFFRNDKLDFTGPYKWTGTASHQGAQPVANVAAAANYPAPWDTCLPTTNPHSGPALPQNQLAGQALFYDTNNDEITFGYKSSGKRTREMKKDPADIFRRHPWHTTFVENAGPAIGRVIKLWSVHPPPPGGPAPKEWLTALTEIPGIVSAIGATEVRVLCGDFNIDCTVADDPFSQLTNNVQYRSRGNTTNIYTRQNNQPTMMKSSSKGSITTGARPRYKYMSSKGYDNILTAYGGGAGAAANFNVVNRVIGTPPQDVLAPPPAVFTVALVADIPTIRGSVATNNAKDKRFRRLGNYGKIGGKTGASDHTALVVDL